MDGDEDMDTNILHEDFFGAPVPNAVFPGQAPAVLLANGTFGQISRLLDVSAGVQTRVFAAA